MTPDERFRELCGHFGGGNPAGGIWIVGWEEAGEWNSEDEIDTFIAKRRDQSYDWRKPGDSQVREWRMAPIVSKICQQITGRGDTWQHYRDNWFLTADGDLFMTNLYPIARPNVNVLPKSYPGWFGYANQQEYKQKVAESGRFDHLRKFWSQQSPRITICHGQGVWNDYRTTLALGEPTQTLSSDNIEEYSGGVFLTPHLSRSTHMPDYRIGLLTSLARKHWSAAA